MKQTSILNEKCECGRDVDYFKLHKTYLREKNRLDTTINKVGLTMAIILAIAFGILIFYNIYSSGNPDIMNSDEFIFGMQFGAFLVFAYILIFVAFITRPKANKCRKYNYAKKRKSFIKFKRQEKYWHSLNKNQKRGVITGITLPFLIWSASIIIIILLFMEYFTINIIQNLDDNTATVIVFITICILLVLHRIWLKSQSRVINWLLNKSYSHIASKYNVEIEKLFTSYKKEKN